VYSGGSVDPAIRDFFLIVGAALAAYFGAYFKRRGEDKAIKEGFAELLRQSAETTKATKAIEAKISDEVWDRQKRWEMKRDLMFETTKRMSVVKDKLISLCNAFDIAAQAENPVTAEVLGTKKKAAQEFNEAMNALEQNAGLIDLVCNESVKDTTFQACHFMRLCSAEIMNGRTDVFRRSTKGLGDALDTAINAMRAEMGIERVRSTPVQKA
jgi:cytochrome c5